MLSDLYASWSSSSSDSSSGSNTDSDTSSDISAPAFSPLTPETSFDFDADLEMTRQEDCDADMAVDPSNCSSQQNVNTGMYYVPE